jgi:hypothetical protein
MTSEPASYGYETQGQIPGKVLGVVALILSFLQLILIPTALLGAILGHVAHIKSRQAGYKNTPAAVAIVVGWVLTVISLAVVLLIVLWIGGQVAADEALKEAARF